MSRRAGRTFRRFVVAAALAAALAMVGAGAAMAYTVVTRDGHIIHVQARPEIRGLQAYMRLLPTGQLAVIQEEQIDWTRTEAANPTSPVIAVPADAKMTRGEGDRQDPGSPIQRKIVGTPAPKGAAAPPAAEQTARQKTQDGGAPDPNKVNAQEAIIKLQKEYAQVAAARDEAAERKKTLEAEVARLQSTQVGYASEDTAAAKRIRELQMEITTVNDEISRCETRLNDIRAEVGQLGGSID